MCHYYIPLLSQKRVFLYSPGRDYTSLLKDVHGLPTKSPLFLDAEGSRDGSIQSLRLFIAPKNVTYLIALEGKRGGNDLFTTNVGGVSPKSILESDSTPIVSFDAGKLSRVLSHQYSIKVADVLQSHTYMARLVKCVEEITAPLLRAHRRVGTGNVRYQASEMLDHLPWWSMKRVHLFPTLWDIYCPGKCSDFPKPNRKPHLASAVLPPSPQSQQQEKGHTLNPVA
ncbi:hypothetical protein SLS62_003062 [Diatrype stigma]|uniref:Uncharacterized protein n=1 Tax=Diatrype stigma TaxID=117547 RepID=A0AAN9UVH8_9PEZI